MLFRFCPRVEALEVRDVPASLSFQLSDGEVGHGSFTTPAGVDASQALQTFALTDLVVSVHGKTMGAGDLLEDGGENEDGVATARFAYGVLIGLKAEYRVPGTVNDLFSVINDEARWMPSPYPQGASTGSVAFDGADAQATFTLPGDVAGALSYDIPWNQVDPTQASQSVALTTFNLNIAGQNFAYGTANFTTAPSALFEYGEFKGLSYAINTSTTPGFAYSSVSQSGMNITAVPNVGQPILVLAAVKEPALVIDFSSYNSTSTAHTLRVRWKLSDGTDELVQIPIAAGTAPGVVRDLVASVLQDNGLKATELGETRLRVKGTAAAKFKELSVDVINPPAGWAGPKYAGRVVTPDISPKYVLAGTEYP